MSSTAGPRLKEVSARLIKPTQPKIDLDEFLKFAQNWQTAFEFGEIAVFDEGIAQYSLCDKESHHKFYAALVLNKPSLRVKLLADEPDDVLEEAGNRFQFVRGGVEQKPVGEAERALVRKLVEILGKKGYKFPTEIP